MNAEFLSNNKPIHLMCRGMEHRFMQSQVACFCVISVCYTGKIFLST